LEKSIGNLKSDLPAPTIMAYEFLTLVLNTPLYTAASKSSESFPAGSITILPVAVAVRIAAKVS
jgi:beta-lactamase class A